MAKPKLGSGERFRTMVEKLMSENPDWTEEHAKAVAAKIGRKTYGKKRFQKLASAGRKRG